MQQLLTKRQAAQLLGVTSAGVKKLEAQGILHSVKNTRGVFFDQDEINTILGNRGLTITQQAAQYNSRVTQKVVSTLQYRNNRDWQHYFGWDVNSK